eukprot:4411979-Alexandrium_andersonii.AAC.1
MAAALVPKGRPQLRAPGGPGGGLKERMAVTPRGPPGAMADVRADAGAKVGQADAGRRALGLFSMNLNSWHANGPRCLDKVEALGGSVFLVQETHLSAVATPAARDLAHARAWSSQFLPARPPSGGGAAQRRGVGHRGGVGVLVKEPGIPVILGQRQSNDAHFLAVE